MLLFKRYVAIGDVFLTNNLSQLMEHNLILRGYDPATVVPGNINTEKFECLVHLEENTAKLWKDVIAKTYSDIVVEKTGSKDKQ